MKKLVFVVFFQLILLHIFVTSIKADLINPDYLTKKCSPGKIEVECSYRSSKPFGPKTFDGCAKYKNDSNYSYLTSEGHSFGGKEKYCYTQGDSVNFLLLNLKKLFSLVIITIALESIFYFLVGFKNKKQFLSLVFANLVSVSLLYLATLTLPYSNYLIVLGMELAVVVFEAWFIKLVIKTIRVRKILLLSFGANLISAIVGTLILALLM
ncbi:hypothetical protein IPM62_00700 [Candidatus Woesebacteria bacterium]|nr:MAG: hypothetical protein IPM62_00700 [Candidatus Woesebacteria bacterium]